MTSCRLIGDKRPGAKMGVKMEIIPCARYTNSAKPVYKQCLVVLLRGCGLSIVLYTNSLGERTTCPETEVLDFPASRRRCTRPTTCLMGSRTCLRVQKSTRALGTILSPRLVKLELYWEKYNGSRSPRESDDHSQGEEYLVGSACTVLGHG